MYQKWVLASVQKFLSEKIHRQTHRQTRPKFYLLTSADGNKLGCSLFGANNLHWKVSGFYTCALKTPEQWKLYQSTFLFPAKNVQNRTLTWKEQKEVRLQANNNRDIQRGKHNTIQQWDKVGRASFLIQVSTYDMRDLNFTVLIVNNVSSTSLWWNKFSISLE